MKDNQVQTHTAGGTMQPAPLYESILSQEGIRVTAVRLLVLKAVYALRGAFTLQDVVDKLGTADPSSVFRTLTLFADKGLLHLIDDGSGAQKYCVCHLDDTRHCEGHVHLTCTSCHRTYCLNNVRIPPVALPNWFEVEEAEYIVKGICEKCKEKLNTT